MFRELGIDDQLHYWFISGDHASVIEWEVVLREEIEESVFKQAVLTAMRIHTNFRSHPVVVNGRVKVSVEDVKQIPVFVEDGIPRQIGTAETEGYLFYFSFSGCKLYLRLFHGLADGHGSFAFLATVLSCYLKETKQIRIDLPEPDSYDDVPVTEQVLKEYAGCAPIGRFNSDDHMDDVFRLSVDRFNEKERKWRVFEIDVPLAPLLSVSKGNESSVVPALEAMIGNSIRRKYDVGDKLIIGYTPVDMRPVFGIETGSNGSTTVAVPYRAEMDQYDFGKRSMLLRSILDMQVQPENICTGLMSVAEGYNKVNSQPYPIEMIIPVVRQKTLKMGSMTPYTYGLSYPGKICFPEQVEQFVGSIVVSVSACSFPLMIEACEFNGIIRMMVTQVFESDEVAKIIFDEISSVIPGTDFIDRGMKLYDRMDLEKLEHIDVNNKK